MLLRREIKMPVDIIMAKCSTTAERFDDSGRGLGSFDYPAEKELYKIWEWARENGIPIVRGQIVALNKRQVTLLLEHTLNLDAYVKAYVSNTSTLYVKIIKIFKTFLQSDFVSFWILWDC